MNKGSHNLTSILSAALLIGWGSASVKAEIWAEDDSFLEDLPVVVTVTRLPQNVRELPAAVTIIDRDMIQASGVVELTDLFRLVPGFQVGHYHGAEGARTVVTSHGFSDQYARRMQVLIDGRSVYKPSTGGAEWQDLPIVLDDIERIEVIRGSSAASHGANAMVGVINIITRHPSEQQGSRIEAMAGERGYRQTSLRHAGGHGALHYRVGGEFSRSEGYQDLSKDGDRLHDDMLTRKLNLRADYRAGVNDYLSLQIGASNGERDAGSIGNDVDVPRSKAMDSHYYYLQWQRIIDTESEVQLKLSHDYHRIRDQYQTAMLSDILGFDPAPAGVDDQALQLDLALKAERTNLEFSHRFRPLASMQLVWGAELREDKVSAISYFGGGDSYTMHSRNLFFNSEWRPLDSWIVNLGSMMEHNNLIGTQHSPRLALNYLFGQGHYLRAVSARAYRIPSYLEEKARYEFRLANGDILHTLFHSDGGLKPERLDSMELAIGMEQPHIGYDIRLFRNRIRDVISAAQEPRIAPLNQQSWSLQNGGEMDIEGGEFQLRLQADEKTRLHLSYAHVHASGWRLNYYDSSGDTPNQREDVSNSVPETTLGMLLSIGNTRQGELGLGYYHVAPMKFIAGNSTDGMDTIDISYRQPFRLGESRGQWRVLLRDVSGSYHTFRRNVSRDRQAFAGVSLNF